MEAKIELLSEARNSVAALRARLNGDFATERFIMETIEDRDKYEIACHALMVTLCQYLDAHAQLLSSNGVPSCTSREILDYMTHVLAQHADLELDVDTRDVA